MANHNVPGGVAASVKVLADAVRDTFGAAIIIEGFLGLALISLSLGLSNLSPDSRCIMMYVIIAIMTFILFALIVLRIWKPSGLGGPPTPTTEDITFKDSSVS
jgi:heme A synthase